MTEYQSNFLEVKLGLILHILFFKFECEFFRYVFFTRFATRICQKKRLWDLIMDFL